jgi:hypothetical protein
MKTYILSILALLTVAAAASSCKSAATVTARPDPNTATSGTLGSVKATTVSLGETYTPQSKDSTLKRH